MARKPSEEEMRGIVWDLVRTVSPWSTAHRPYMGSGDASYMWVRQLQFIAVKSIWNNTAPLKELATVAIIVRPSMSDPFYYWVVQLISNSDMHNAPPDMSKNAWPFHPGSLADVQAHVDSMLIDRGYKLESLAGDNSDE